MRMIELRNEARFTIEALAKLQIGGELGGKDFDRDNPIQARIVGAIDLAHSAGCEEALDFIRTERGARLERAPPGHQSRRRGGRPRLGLIGVLVIQQQGRDFAVELAIAATRVAHEGVAFGWIALQRLLKDFFNLAPPVHCRLSLRRARGAATRGRNSNPGSPCSARPARLRRLPPPSIRRRNASRRLDSFARRLPPAAATRDRRQRAPRPAATITPRRRRWECERRRRRVSGAAARAHGRRARAASPGTRPRRSERDSATTRPDLVEAGRRLPGPGRKAAWN